MSRDLNDQEQANVLAHLRALRARYGTWFRVERMLPLSHDQRCSITSGRSRVTATVAFRIARLLDVPMGEVLGSVQICPHCGQAMPEVP